VALAAAAESAITATRRVTFPVTAPKVDAVVVAAAVVVTATIVVNPAIFLATAPNPAAEVADSAVVAVETATTAISLAICLATAPSPDLEVDVEIPTSSATSAKDSATFPASAPPEARTRDAVVRLAHQAHHVTRHQVFHFIRTFSFFVENHF